MDCMVCFKKMKTRVEAFKDYLPLVSTLFNKGMRERHWVQVSEIIGFHLRPDDDMCLSRLIDMSLEAHLPKFETISEAAAKEYSLEKALEKMKSEWATVSLVLIGLIIPYPHFLLLVIFRESYLSIKF